MTLARYMMLGALGSFDLIDWTSSDDQATAAEAITRAPALARAADGLRKAADAIWQRAKAANVQNENPALWADVIAMRAAYYQAAAVNDTVVAWARNITRVAVQNPDRANYGVDDAQIPAWMLEDNGPITDVPGLGIAPLVVIVYALAAAIVAAGLGYGIAEIVYSYRDSAPRAEYAAALGRRADAAIRVYEAKAANGQDVGLPDIGSEPAPKSQNTALPIALAAGGVAVAVAAMFILGKRGTS